MRLTYLGTAAAEGWPAPFCRCQACIRARERGGRDIRTRSQAIIDQSILIDLPGDTLSHANRFGLDLGAVDCLLITHAHEDHFSPFDLKLRMKPYAQMARPLEVYCNQAVYRVFLQSLKDYDRHYQAYIHFHIVHAFDTIYIGEYRVEALRANHTPGEECLFYRISRNNHSILYAHDTGIFPEDTWAYLKGRRSDLVSLDCTYCLTDLKERHMGLKACAMTRNRMLKQGMADEKTMFILNHFTHNCAEENGYRELRDKAGGMGFLVAYDGMERTCQAAWREDERQWEP